MSALPSTLLNSSHSANLTTSSPPLHMPWEVHHGNAVRHVYIWVLVALGLPANAACVVTVLSMANSPFYVALLAVADSLALLVKLLYHHIYTYDLLNKPACYFEEFVAFFSSYANWVLALICLERFFAVCFPFKKQKLFSKARVHASSVGLAGALFLFFIPCFFFNESAEASGKNCVRRQSMQMYVHEVWKPFLLPSLYFFVPFLLVAGFSATIVSRLFQQRIKRQSFRSATAASASSAANRGAERTISIMLVSAAVVFLVLMLPACLYHLFLERLFDPTVLKESAQCYLLYQVVTVLSDSSHAVNFFVYFLSAGRFRSALVDLVLSRCSCRSCGCQGCAVDAGGVEEAKTHPTTDEAAAALPDTRV